MGEFHDYWCARCGGKAPITIVIAFQGLGDLPRSRKERICTRVDCAADVLNRYADQLRALDPELVQS